MSSRLNIPLMIVSLLISVTLWLVVLAKDIPVPVRLRLRVDYYSNLDKDAFWVNPDPSVNQSTANIKFVGPSDKMQDLSDNLPVVEVDLSHAKPGRSVYPASLNPISDEQYLLNKDISIRVVVENVIKRTVPVEVKQKGTFTDRSFALDSSHVDRQTATVTGPVSMVNRITKCVAYFDLNTVTPSNLEPTQEALRAFDDKNQQYDKVLIDPPNVIVTPVIMAAPSDRTALVSPRIIGQPAPGYLPLPYKIEPSSVTLSGDPDILLGATLLSTEPIDVNGLTRDRTFRVRVVVPLKLRADPKWVTVRYRVHPDPNYQPGSPTPTPPPSSETFPSTVPPLRGSRRGGT